jgi:hypothetical protein
VQQPLFEDERNTSLAMSFGTISSSSIIPPTASSLLYDDG